METKDIGEPSDWQPISDKVVLAFLGKLAEEASELSGIIARTIIQGLDGVNPETKKPNIIALAEEIADVRAMSAIAVKELHLNWLTILERVERKQKMKNKWLDMLRTKP